MTLAPDDWSPADNSYAIAVSQSVLWEDLVHLTIARLRSPQSTAGRFSSEQLDAHTLVIALRQLIAAAQLEHVALEDLSIAGSTMSDLTRAQLAFENALPGIKDMRDGLMHFEDWSRGSGRGPQRHSVRAGRAARDVAREFWPFEYDPRQRAVRFGPYEFQIETAERAASDLCAAIYVAARSVDQARISQLRARVIQALQESGIEYEAPEVGVRLSTGADMQIWLSLAAVDADRSASRNLAELIVAALAHVGLILESTDMADPTTPVELLTRRTLLRVSEMTDHRAPDRGKRLPS